MGAIVGLRREVLKDEALTITDTSAQVGDGKRGEQALDRTTTPRMAEFVSLLALPPPHRRRTM
jgi:hypothetical protein